MKSPLGTSIVIVTAAIVLTLIIGLPRHIRGFIGPFADAQPARALTLQVEATHYPVYSLLFRAKNNPFHLTFGYLKSLKHQAAQPSTAIAMSNNFWVQGIGFQTVQALPLYQGMPSDPAYVVSCTFYNPKGCEAQGARVHLPVGWMTQQGTDKHVASIDLVEDREVDLWGGGDNAALSGPKQCTVINSEILNCSWGGMFPFSGKGITMGGAAVAGGFAEGLFEITAGDLLSGRIQHALGIQGICLDDDASQGTAGAVYPSGRQTKTDNSCVEKNRPSGAPPYGAMWHLKDSVNVPSLGYSKYCQIIVQAMQTYGAYFTDSGNHQIQLEVENPIAYDISRFKVNPFYSVIFPSIVDGGDGRGSGSTGFSFQSCLQRLSAEDFEVYYVPNLGF